MSSNGTSKGKVIWFNSAKGFGFIKRDDGENDLFVHFSSIQAEGYRSLQADQQVEFEIGHSERGPLAKNVVVIG